jgi:hypothetical protein
MRDEIVRCPYWSWKALPSYAREDGGLVPLSEVWTFGKSQHGRLQMSLQEVHGDEPGCVIVMVTHK